MTRRVKGEAASRDDEKSTSLPDRLTAQQRAALGARDQSVALAAGAGCGKTFVLTERFLAEIDPRLQGQEGMLAELAAITFTDAAAREMRSRIRESCYARLRDAPSPDEADAWLQLMRDIDGARISTFHSFCGALLRRFAVEADVDPQFELLDQATADLLHVEAVDDTLRALLDRRDRRVLELAAEVQIEGVRDNLSWLLRDALGTPHQRISTWLQTTPDALAADWHHAFRCAALPAARDELIANPVFRDLVAVADPLRANEARLADHLSELGGLLREATNASELDGAFFMRLRETAKTHGFIKPAKWHDAEDHASYRAACAGVRDLLDRSLLCKEFDRELAREAAAKSLQYMSLCDDVRQLVDRRKGERRQLEFADLVLGAHRLLTDPQHAAVASQIAGEIKLLMVDEFQDTDPLQVELVQALAPTWQHRGLFVVGDAKQSIYRFRGAAPEVSRNLRASLPATSRLSLTHNFRSQPAIVDFVNAVFHDALDEPYEALQAVKPQVAPLPAVEFLWAPATDDAPEAGAAGVIETVENNRQKPAGRGRRPRGAVRDGRRREAVWIARRLLQMLRDQEPIVADANAPGGVRGLRLGDVAMLFRALSDVPLYEEALRAHGLDYHLAGGHAFYAQQEVFDMLNLLRAIASSIDEPSLAGALRSPCFALADETLYWMVETYGSLNGAIAMAQPPKQLATAEAQKLVRARETLHWLRNKKDRLLVADLIRAAWERTGYDAALQAEFLGDRKLANLEKLVEQARQLDRTSPGDLAGYITQLGEFVTRPPKEALAAVQAEGNAIRLMTIHHAKGLEFPLVIVPDLDRSEHAGASRPVIDDALGPLMPGKEGTGLTGWDVYRARERRQECEERKRLFYVACTRAADYLILSASSANLAKPKSESLRLLGDRFDLRSGVFSGPRPKDRFHVGPRVRVTENEPALVGELASEKKGVDLLKVVDRTRALAAQLGQESASIVDPPRGRDRLELPREAREWVAPGRHQRRFSFSRLSGELARATDEGETEPLDADQEKLRGREAPKRRARDAIDPRELGNLVHAALEQWNFSQGDDAVEACRWAGAALQADDRTTARAAELVARFTRSERAAHLSSAQRLLRETEFLLAWPLEGETGPPRYLQGVIDCLYVDSAGAWRLIDYKTNRVKPEGVAAAAKAYEIQMFVYSEACRRALGIEPVETTLCFLYAEAEHPFEWTDERRRSAASRVTKALRAAVDRDSFRSGHADRHA